MNNHVPSPAPGSDGAATEHRDLEALRALLLLDERHRTQGLKTEIDELRRAALLDTQFETRLAEALTTALANAQAQDPKGMARALAPAVVKSIRREIVNSRDDMVEALYPITGRLVSAAVRDAIRKLAADINRRVDSATSPQFVVAKVRSVVTRRPVSDFLITQTGPAHIASVLVMDKATGNVMREWLPDDGPQSEETPGAAPRTALYSALASFAENHGGGTDSQLREIDLNGHKVLMHHTVRKTLVAEFDGSLTAAQLEAFAQDGSWLQEQTPQTIASSGYTPRLLTAGKSVGRGRRIAKRIVWSALLAGLVGLSGWFVFEHTMFARDLADIRAQIDASGLDGYPLSVTGNRSDATARIEGLLPIGATLPVDDMTARMRRVETIAVATRPIADDAAIAALTAGLDARSARANALEGRLEALDGAITENRSGLDALNERIAANQSMVSGLGGSLNALEGRLGTLSGQSGAQASDLAQSRQAIEAIGRRIAALSTDLANLLEQTARDAGALDADLEDLNREVIALRAEIAALETRNAAQNAARAATLTAFIEAQELRFDDAAGFAEPDLAHAALTRIADAAIETGARLRVLGFGDLVGTPERTLAVSAERAALVAQILETLGVGADRLDIIGMGAQVFEGKTPDRRVVLRVVSD